MNLKCRPLIFLIFSISLNSYSQLNSGNLTQYTEKDGLPGAEVHSILTDKLGYLWIGTVNGLTRYDGYEFKRFYYNPNDTASIHGLNVWSLFEDRKGEIWVGSAPSFLNVYNPIFKTFRQYDFTHLINHPANIELGIGVMCEDNNGRIYFGINTNYGDAISPALLYKDEKDDKLKRFNSPDSLPIQNVYRITKDKAGNIWFLSYSGLFEINVKGKLSKIHSMDNSFNAGQEYPTDIRFDKGSHLWLVTNKNRLFDFIPETGTYKIWFSNELYTAADNNNFYRTIIMDRDDNIWMGTNKGIQFFNRKTGQFSAFNNGIKKELEHTPVGDLCFDSFGTLWIGSWADGLLKYEDKPQLKSYKHNEADKNSFTPGWANYIYEAIDGKIWISTNAGNSSLNILDSRTGILQSIPSSSFPKRLNVIFSIWGNTPGELFLGSLKAVYSFSEKTHTLKPIRLAGAPDTLSITYYFKDSRENEWLCTFTGLYKKEKGAQSYKYYALNKLPGSDASSNEITRAFESRKHGLWLITNNGLFLYDYATDKIVRHGFDKNEGNIFVTQDINSFYEDPKGIAWVGTWQGGLSRYNVETKKIKSYTRNDGLPSMSIQSILADEKNNSLWLSTFDGLSRFNLATQQFNNFSIADGIQGQLFADGSCLKTSTGLFVFGGSNGITIFNPDEVNKNSNPPKVFLTDLKLFNKSIVPGGKSILKRPIEETGQITLAYNQNNISLEFIALHYSNPSLNKYSYKLEKYDNEWRDVGNQHVAFYPNLPPGEYTFRVKAANDKGVWNEQGATLKIIINPPWWKTTWAYILYGLLFIALAFAVDRYVRRRLVQKERERGRIRELEQAKEIEKAYYKLEETHETLKATQTQLIQSEKMASLGELTAGIAHEIQNPLNFVNNFSEVNSELIAEMKQEIDNGSLNEVKSLADNIDENEQKIIFHGKRADAIVKGMLQHSRSSSGVKEPTDINALADEYFRLAYHGLRAKDKSFNATMKTDFDESIGNINIIPQDIGRVILNLITNAFYAVTEKNASLRTSGQANSAGQQYEPTVSVSTKKINDKIEIKVADNGNGIPQKVLDKIFQPFF
ncbi:MAG TPA: two-component regulator propeller domain-containing protein, partial [Chitinophagaceae bacterium]|nr:two-component regulator propeller domain-containing protein [Chitinophagaceae bacterium]